MYIYICILDRNRSISTNTKIYNIWGKNLKVSSIFFNSFDTRRQATGGCKEAASHDVKPALGDPRCGSNAFRFCVSSATRESSQGQVVPRFRASLRRSAKIDSNEFHI